MYTFLLIIGGGLLVFFTKTRIVEFILKLKEMGVKVRVKARINLSKKR